MHLLDRLGAVDPVHQAASGVVIEDRGQLLQKDFASHVRQIMLKQNFPAAGILGVGYQSLSQQRTGASQQNSSIHHIYTIGRMSPACP